MLDVFSWRMTGVVAGLSLFSITISPRKVSPLSTCSLKYKFIKHFFTSFASLNIYAQLFTIRVERQCMEAILLKLVCFEGLNLQRIFLFKITQHVRKRLFTDRFFPIWNSIQNGH